MLLAPHPQYTATFILLKRRTRVGRLPYHQLCLALLLENYPRLRGILRLAITGGPHHRQSSSTLETYLALRKASW